MRNKKMLCILIPVLVVVLALIAGIIFITLNSSPEKIFEHSINKVFSLFESLEEISTMKGTMNITGSVESDDEEVQAVKDMLEGSSIGLDMQVDTKNMVINEVFNVTFNNESLLNASILLQDEKGYVYLPDWLDKYLQVPEEELDYSELTEAYNKTATLDQDALTEAVKEELIKTVTAQELVQEKITLVLDGKETNVKASILHLKDAQITRFYSELFTNLKNNEKFLNALGEYKEDAKMAIDEMISDVEDAEDLEFIFAIYTKGFLNEFVGLSGKVKDNDFEEETGFEFIKQNDEKYEFKAYNVYDGEREDAFDIVVENKKESKNKGTAIITMEVEEEQFAVTYNYETQKNKTTFVASTEIEGVRLSVSGNTTEDGNNIKGDFIISVQEESFGRVNVNCTYDFTYNVEIQKVDVQNAVSINELSEEDQTTFMTNIQNSQIYQLIEQFGLSDFQQESLGNEPQVSYDGFTVKYNVPGDFEVSQYSSESYKMYMDENFNSVNISIDFDTVDGYMRELDNDYILTSDFYENQKISEIKTYEVNGKEYKFRTITYNDDFGSYAKIYFAYELDDEYCYVVEVESQGGISMETIKQFLDVIVQ